MEQFLQELKDLIARFEGQTNPEPQNEPEVQPAETPGEAQTETTTPEPEAPIDQPSTEEAPQADVEAAN